MNLKEFAIFVVTVIVAAEIRRAIGRGREWKEFVPVNKLQLREEAREMFYHGFDNYMKYAFPHDELRPISGSSSNSFIELGNLDLSRLSQNYSGVALTLIDSLSTLVVLGDKKEFEKAVKWLSANLSFAVDARVNVFEATIRGVGGLLSAYYLATDGPLGTLPESSHLLRLAVDLAERLLPAFNTTSGIPYAWVNLLHGVEVNETTEQCTAGIATGILEFTMLSMASNDSRFEDTSRSALKHLWAQRSPLGLLGTNLDVETLQWTNPNSGIGAGVDSFYESLFKCFILSGDPELWNSFREAYAAVLKHLRYDDWYVEANMFSGKISVLEVQSLQSFWPGLQVLAGDIEAAERTYQKYFGLWERFGVLPERFLLHSNSLHPTQAFYPLRPELAESTYFLFRATRKEKYLRAGETILRSLQRYCRVDKGWASVKEITTMTLEDHMPSYFLAEMSKYLYLLFDEANWIHQGNYVFSTEGHPFPVLPMADRLRRKWYNFAGGQCPFVAT